MGMGKTIQTISTIVAGRMDYKTKSGLFAPPVAPPPAPVDSDADDFVERSKPAAPAAPQAIEWGPTLVVCPVSAMMQWSDEIKMHTAEGLASCDVVLTTYAVVEVEYRAIIDKMKVAC